MEHTKKYYDCNSDLTVISKGTSIFADFDVCVQDSDGNRLAYIPRIYNSPVGFSSSDYSIIEYHPNELVLVFWYKGDWYFVTGTIIYSPFRGYTKKHKLFETVIDWMWSRGIDMSSGLDINRIYILQVIEGTPQLIMSFNKNDGKEMSGSTIFESPKKYTRDIIYKINPATIRGFMITSPSHFTVVSNLIYERKNRWTEYMLLGFDELFVHLYKSREIELFLREYPEHTDVINSIKTCWFSITKDITNMIYTNKYADYVSSNHFLMSKIATIAMEHPSDIFSSVKIFLNSLSYTQQVILLASFKLSCIHKTAV